MISAVRYIVIRTDITILYIYNAYGLLPCCAATVLIILEGLLGDSADTHFKEIEDAKLKLGDLRDALGSCASTEHHSNLEQDRCCQIHIQYARTNA